MGTNHPRLSALGIRWFAAYLHASVGRCAIVRLAESIKRRPVCGGTCRTRGYGSCELSPWFAGEACFRMASADSWLCGARRVGGGLGGKENHLARRKVHIRAGAPDTGRL